MIHSRLLKAAADYHPAPVNTDAIVLPDGILELTETIARNTHEVWASMRKKEGWRYGPTRDDALKLHPNLVPYEFLSEESREYDRATALNVLRLIIQLGYTIKAPGEATATSF